VYSGNGDMPIEHAIREFRFAFGSSASAKETLNKSPDVQS